MFFIEMGKIRRGVGIGLIGVGEYELSVLFRDVKFEGYFDI